MPAVVRGGRRQSSNQPAKRGSASGSKGRGRAPRNAPAIPGKMAAIGRLDLSPRAVVISIAAGVVLLAGVLATGARAERIGASIGRGVDGVAVGMGLKLEKVFIEGESPEATVAVRLIDKRTAKPVPDAVIFSTRMDMAPEGMEAMTTPVEAQPSTEAGIYSFKTNLSMEGGWRFKLAAKVQGETETVQGELVLQAQP